jgi:23S rRNA pseudouridine2605 synthase
VKQRIQKVLANAGVASRRSIEQMIRDGRIAVNGRIHTELPILIDPAIDKIVVDGDPVRFADESMGPRIYILLHKPKGVYSTNVAQGEQTRAIDLLPPKLPGRVYPVGRLDAQTKGLLLMTNDGDLTNRLTHPRFGVAKTYRAVIAGEIEPRAIAILSKGIWLSDQHSGVGFKTGKSHLKVVSRSRDLSIVEITIREGRDRPIRRMFARIGYKVRDLTRIRMGPLTLDGLSPGQFRNLTAKEIAQLRAVGQNPHKPDAEPGRPRPGPGRGRPGSTPKFTT